MRSWSGAQVARAAGAERHGASSGGGPERIVVDSRKIRPGDLFVGLPGQHSDGGSFAAQALENGAWGTLSAPGHAERARLEHPGAEILSSEDPLASLQRLATAWRRHLGADLIGVTGSTGKTSTKDLLNALISPHRRTIASRANFNTEVGLPLELANAPEGTEVLILEMGMRGPGQIAELAEIAEPDVGVIVSIGPVHLELLGSIEAIAAAKAELIGGVPSGGTAVVPADERLLDPHRRDDIETITFGPGGEVTLKEADAGRVVIDLLGETVELEVDFTQAHMRNNLLAAAAAAHAVGVTPSGRVELRLSPGRGQREALPGELTLIDDCYNANPMSMRAALDDFASAGGGTQAASRRVAVLGDMLELGPDELRYHREIGAHAADTGVDVLITVGPLAEAMAAGFGGESHVTADAAEAAATVTPLLRPGDTVLVKASRGVALEGVCQAIREHATSGASASL